MKADDKQKNLYTLNTNLLKKGDIILTTSKHRVSNIIRIVTLGPFSHAMIYLGGDCCADAGGPGVRVASHNTQRIFFDSPNHCSVLRLKEDISDNQLDAIVDNARRMIGMEYSLDEAKLVALRVKFNAKEINRQFCSRYVAQAYSNAGINIVNNSDYCSPVNINESDLLIKVDNYLRIASDEERAVFLEESIPLSAKDFADEFIFSNAKKASGIDIQTDEQFNAVVIKFPQLDAEFSQILTDSGYLTLWQLEKNENPWFYDFESLKVKFPDNDFIIYLGNKQLPVEYELQRGFNLTLQTLQNSYVTNRLHTLKLQIELYNTLIDLSKTREEIWTKCKNI
jgi:uncharacterized protein YycO